MPTLDTTQVEQRVFAALESFGAEPTEISLDATFKQLDVDSLDLAELSQIVEDEYGVEIKSGDVERLKTVGDVIALIVERS
jgi:acyl carrier protein